MACGKAVVATEAGGVPEALEGCGIMVKSRDPKSMAAGILTLLKDPEMRRTYEERSLQRAHEKFSLSGMVSQYRELYNGLAEGSVRSPLKVQDPAEIAA